MSNILQDRLNQLGFLYHEIIINPMYSTECKDDLIDCLSDCWRAIKKFYGVKEDETIRPD